MRKIQISLLALLCVCLLLGSCHRKEKTTAAASSSVAPAVTAVPETTSKAAPTSVSAAETTPAAPDATASALETTAEPQTEGPIAGNYDGLAGPHPACPALDHLRDFVPPEYEGQPYLLLNEGVPFFKTEDLTPVAYECYYDLDALGRCTLADAVAGRETMPTEKRGNISSVKPTGWQSSVYPQNLLDGGSLYNRCHLIAFGLCGENANPYNLVTGTRYFNTKGVNDFENMVIDYIRETGCHVRYRVTPVFVGEELVCRGQILEAWSIEDQGDAICICIYAFNVQPGIEIDYLTGDNWEAESGRPAPTEAATTVPDTLAEDLVGDFVLNVKKLKVHWPDCAGLSSMSEKNKQAYKGSVNELLLQGYTLCPDCMGKN